jgi:hypothetical protein
MNIDVRQRNDKKASEVIEGDKAALAVTCDSA